MQCRVDHHRSLVWIIVRDLFVHIEQVTVFLLNDLFTQAIDRVGEIQEYGQARAVHAETCVATLFSGTRSHVARNQVSECRITPLQIIITVVVTQGFGHHSQFRLEVTFHRYASRVDLNHTRISEVSAFLVALPCGGTVRCHSVG